MESTAKLNEIWRTSKKTRVAGPLYKTCTLAASRLGQQLKETIESAKKEDFTAAVKGVVALAQEAGKLDVCGAKLEKENLINAAVALCPRNWVVVQEQLTAFGEKTVEKMLGPA